MNSKIDKLFIAIANDKVVCISSNVTGFYRKIKEIEPNVNSQSYYEKKFKTETHIAFEGSEIKYTFQKIVNNKS